MVNTTADLFDGQTYQDRADTAYDLSAQNGGNTACFSNRLHTGYIGKAYSQDNGKGRAEMKAVFASDGEELQKRCQSGYHKGSLD